MNRKPVDPGLVLLLILFSISIAVANPLGVDESAGACESYKELSGVGDDSLDCSPGPNYDICGDEAGENRAHVKGPAVDEPVISQYPSHYYACLDSTEQDYCVLPSGEDGTEKVPEGTMANVAQKFNDGADDYQDPANSPDWSVCINTDGTSDPGGKWYSLDNSDAGEYLRNNKNIVDNGDSSNESHIAYY